jgi:hypothetical protein
MKQIWIVSGLVVAALGASALIVGGGMWFGHSDTPTTTQDMPWQVSALPGGGSQVLGLTLGEASPGRSTLGDVLQRWGDKVQVAIVAAPNESGTLEAYVDPMQAGFISGKAIITAHLPPEVIQGMRERATKTEYMGGTTRKATLSSADLAEALQAPVTAVSFIPAANLDEDIILSRFGQPAQRVRSNGHLEHFLYPEKGLDLALDSEGKELLQYVAPAEFERLRQPLLAAAASAPAAASPPSAP